MITFYDTSIIFMIVAIIGILITGISKSGFAGGSGVVAVPLLALLIPISHAVIIVLPLLIIMDMKTIHYYYKNKDFKEVMQIIPAALVGIIIGGFLLGTIDENHLQFWFGLICIIFASWQGLAPIFSKIKGAAMLWGCVSGITSTLIHSGAPPFNIYMISRGLPKKTWLATAGLFFFVMNCVKIIPYSLLGEWSSAMLWTSLLLVPVALLGTYLGKLMQNVVSEKLFVSLCRLFLFLSGGLLIYKGLASI